MFNKKIFLFGIGIFIIIFIFLGLNIVKLQKDVDLLENKIMQLEGQYDGAVQNAKYQLEETIKREENIVSSYSFKASNRKIKDETMYFDLKVFPKVYVDGMNAEFIISGKDTYKYKLEYIDRAYIAKIPVNLNETELYFTICFNDGKHVDYQQIDIDSDVVEKYIMRVSYEDELNISELDNKVRISGDVITTYSPIYDSDMDTKPSNYPEKGIVIIKKNGSKIVEKDIEFEDISDGQYSSCNIYTKLNETIDDYEKGDIIEVFAKVVDNFGNITEKTIKTFK